MLALTDVRKRFQSAGGKEVVQAVDGVSLSIGRGELVALYGPSGSGKTTLLKIIAALLRPDSGSIVVDGREISTLSRKEAGHYRLTDIGWVRQQPSFVAGATALDNAALKLLGSMRLREARRVVQPILHELGLAERLDHRPTELSSGEQQRVMIARALSTGPSVLLADEPTGSLDSRRSRDVLEMLRGLCHERGVAALLVTHDAQASEVSDRALELRDGRLGDYVAEGVR